jgi:formylglycine-generating enzyme required for sulfatase activity
MVSIKGGSYVPLYGSLKSKNVKVNDFMMDITPVTNKQFLDFVINNPKWKRSQTKEIFADKNYLKSWISDTQVPPELLETPVTHVSWFAAKAYCDCQGKRLPSVDEWEYVAMADGKKADARRDSLFNKTILQHYETPKTYLKKVGQTSKNFWGVQDLHGIVWEWTSDFNSIIIDGESRSGGETNKGTFCASASVGARDLMNYAAFMRYAFRSSIKANYAITTLGFRCVKDGQKDKGKKAQ